MIVRKIKECIQCFKYVRYLLSEFPDKDIKTGMEVTRLVLKGTCPLCLTEPIERLSHYEYAKKYPVTVKIDLGKYTVELCDKHYKELYNEMKKDIEESEDLVDKLFKELGISETDYEKQEV